MSNYETVPSPNYVAYANSNFGAKLGEMLQGIPDQYLKGRENARKIQFEDAFKDGVPRNEDKSLNVNAIMDKGMKIGGLPFAQPLLQYMLDLEAGKQWSSAIPSEQGSVPPAPAGSAAGPGNITAGTQPVPRPQSPPLRQPQLSAAGTDDKGEQTINSLASEVFGDRDMTAALPRYAAAVRNKLGEPLTVEQEQRARMLMTRSAASMGIAGGASSEDTTQPSRATSAPEVGTNSGGRAPFMGGSTPAGGPTSGAPAPAGGRAPNAIAQAGAGMASVDNAGAGAGPGGAIRQTPVGTAEDARIAFVRATNMRKAALAMPSTNPGRQKALLDQAQAEQTKGMEILKSLGEYNKPTTEMQNAEASGVRSPAELKASEERSKEEATRYGKDYEGYRKLGQESQTGLQKAGLAKAMINNPNFYSGPLQPTHQLYKQFQSVFGENPNTAVPPEAMEKVINDMLGEQIRALGGSGVGQVRVAEVNIMKKAIANMGITPATNRMLIDIVSRTYKDNMELAKMAREYKGGRLDAGFDRKVAEYYQDHPLFSKDELQDPRLIAPREFKSFPEAKAAKLPKGEPVKIKGELYHVDTK
jgi:hypothetical protein